MTRPNSRTSHLLLALLALLIMPRSLPAAETGEQDAGMPVEAAEDAAGTLDETAGPGGDKEGFFLDPQISGGVNQPSVPHVTSPLTISRNGDQTNLSVETGGQVSPYLGAVRSPRPSEDVRHLTGEQGRNPLDSYRLETGVGVKMSDRTDLNLGYRFEQSPSLLEDRDAQRSAIPGQFRFGIDFTLPAK